MRSSENTACHGTSPIWAALRMSQAAPETTTTTRLPHSIHASQERTRAGTSPPACVPRNTGSAIKARKSTVPVRLIVAAKWTARTQTSGSSNPALLLADPEYEGALGAVRVGRERAPLDDVDARRQWLQRSSDDVSVSLVDVSIRLVDSFADGAAYDDGAKSGFEPLAEIERDFGRRRRHGAVDGR